MTSLTGAQAGFVPTNAPMGSDARDSGEVVRKPEATIEIIFRRYPLL